MDEDYVDEMDENSDDSLCLEDCNVLNLNGPLEQRMKNWPQEGGWAKYLTGKNCLSNKDLPYRQEIKEEEVIDLRKYPPKVPQNEDAILESVDKDMLYLSFEKNPMYEDSEGARTRTYAEVLYYRRLNNKQKKEVLDHRIKLRNYIVRKKNNMYVSFGNNLLKVNDSFVPNLRINDIDLVYFGLAEIIGVKKAIRKVGNLILKQIEKHENVTKQLDIELNKFVSNSVFTEVSNTDQTKS